MFAPRKNVVLWLTCLLLASASQAKAGLITLFSNPVNTANGDCFGFQCYYSWSFAADNFTLLQDSTVQRIDFTGIRTGTPPGLGFTTTATLEFFNFDPSWNNSLYNQPFGSMITSYSGVVATQVGVTYYESDQAFIEFAVDLPPLPLSAGQYWLALHADVSGWSGTLGDANDTSLYWAFGYGDGTWAWNLFCGLRKCGSPPGEWSNPNPGLGGQA